jgi:glycosyltransferase involved in cell wall biosynthesis
VCAHPGIELLVAYPGSRPGTQVEAGGVTFADIGPLEPVSRVARVIARWNPGPPRPAILDECARVAIAWGADLVHVHGTESGLARVSDRLELPVLISIQGLLSVLESVHAEDGGDAEAPPSWLGGFARGLTPWHSARALHAAARTERLILSGCRHVAGRTAFDRRVSAVLAPNASYTHVGEVLRDPFYTSRWTIREKAPLPMRLSMCGRNFHRKGVDVAIESARVLAASGVDVRLTIFGAGADSEDARRALSRASLLGVADRVDILGELTAEQVVTELVTCDAYLHPSRGDNSPNGLCEAMMLGVPCVASTAGGIPSLATDGVDALLVPPGDPYSLAGAVKILLADRLLASRLSEAARQRAATRHDPTVVRAELVRTYQQIAGS